MLFADIPWFFTKNVRLDLSTLILVILPVTSIEQIKYVAVAWIKSIHVRVLNLKNLKNNAWVAVNNEFWVTSEAICQKFSRVTVTSENYWQIASRVTQKSLFTVTNVLFYFLHAISCPWTHNSAKNNDRLPISLLWLRTVFSDLSVTSGYWHCVVIFVDCSCTHKLAQRRSSFVNNKCEYRFLTTWYSRLSV